MYHLPHLTRFCVSEDDCIVEVVKPRTASLQVDFMFVMNKTGTTQNLLDVLNRFEPQPNVKWMLQGEELTTSKRLDRLLQDVLLDTTLKVFKHDKKVN